MRRALLCACCALAALAVACGVPSDGEPRTLARDNVPFGLLQPSDTPTTARSRPGEAASFDVFLLRERRLQPAGREVDAPVTLSQVLATLLEGPTPEEKARGLHTAVIGRSLLLAADLVGSVARVNISDPAGDLQGERLSDALAQIVFTATGVPTLKIGSVEVSIDGKPVAATDPSGSTTRPLDRNDFPNLFAA